MRGAAITAPVAAPSEPTRVRVHIGETALYLIIALLVGAAWWVSRLGYFASKDDFGYWLGVTGGVMMLLLLAYPLRKHARFMQNLGPVRIWFAVHMVFGIAGPVLILLHSTFKLGSLNATVALVCMLVVAGSGVVGRFLYRHIHRGLLGEKSSLAELQAVAGREHEVIANRFHSVPTVEARLLAFEAASLRGDAGWGTHLHRVFILPWQRRLVHLRCTAELDRVLRQHARARSLPRSEIRARRRKAHGLLRKYLASVTSVAQFTAYERMFALWHVLHVPFVYIMVVSTIAHVIAVHAY